MAAGPSAAPVFKVAPREVFAVEHPMIVMNLDKGLKTFGTNGPFKRVSSAFIFERLIICFPSPVIWPQ